jgi:acyl carrier protein
MGLDAVEIIMEVEDPFDVSVDEAEAKDMTRPRNLLDS